jgi:hypothetical protein
VSADRDLAPGWEPWEARRARAPKAASWELREARQDAALLLMVVRARFTEGAVPIEHTERLAAVAQDERVSLRRRRVAASLLARLRMAAMAGVVREAGGTVRGRGDRPAR